MNYKKGLKHIKETTLSGGGTFGTAAGIGQHGGDVGNSDFYASGNSMNLYGGVSDPDRPYGKKKGKKGRKKEKFHLYKRAFSEAIISEDVDKMDLDLECVIRSPTRDCIKVLKDILVEGNIGFVEHRGDIVSFTNKDEVIQNILNRYESIVGEDNIFALIGEMDQIHGGKSDGKTVEDIARHHGVPVEEIEAQLKIGMKIEMEHTDDSDLAKEIALDHLWEFVNYYTELTKLEDKLKKQNE